MLSSLMLTRACKSDLPTFERVNRKTEEGEARQQTFQVESHSHLHPVPHSARAWTFSRGQTV